MSRPYFGVRAVLPLAAAGVLALTGTSSASGTPRAASSPPAPPTASATWTLEQSDQEVCSRPDTGPHNFYFLSPVTGSTTKDIRLELQDLPVGVTSKGGTIHPGELNDHGKFNGFVHVAIGPTRAGEYDIALVASAGTDSQSSPARISIRADC